MRDYYEVEVSNGVVYVDETVINTMAYLYDGLERELPLCAYGRGIDGFVWVNKVNIPEIVKSTPEQARFISEDCKRRSDYVGIIHNHPTGNNNMSITDIVRFLEDKRARVEIIVGGADRESVSVDFKAYLKG